MKILGYIVFAVLAFFVVRAGLTYISEHGRDNAAAAGMPILQVGRLPGEPLVRDIGPLSLSGRVWMDATNGYPHVPYIAYYTDEGKLRTKQLVYAHVRGCSPTAADFPCAPEFSEYQGYPELTHGQEIRATGYISDNRFLVTNLESTP